MSAPGVPFVDHAAVIHGRAAVGVAFLLERADLDTLPAAVQAETVAAINAVSLASRAWVRKKTAVVGTGSATTATRDGAGGAESRHGELTVPEAAAVLGVKERQARNLAAAGMGRRVGGRWMLDAALVELEAERRGAA